MNDMSAVIIPKSDQISSDDLIAGPMTITITRVTIKPGADQPVSMNYDGDGGKVFRPCKSMARVMVSLWGADANQYIGRSMTLFRDPKVLWGGMAVGGIRISHLSHISEPSTMALTATKGSKKLFTVHPLKVAPPTNAEPTPAAVPAPMAAPPKHTWADALAALDAELLAAPDGPAVDKILTSPRVQKMLDQATNGTKKRLDAIVQAALTRTTVEQPAPEPLPPEDEVPF